MSDMIAGGTVGVQVFHFWSLLRAAEHDADAGCDCGQRAVPQALDLTREQWLHPVALIVAEGVRQGWTQ